MEEKLNLYQKMLKITEEIGVVFKNLQVKDSKGETKYHAIGEVDVLDKVKPLEIKYGIYSFPYAREFTDLNIQGRVAMRVSTIYRFLNVDDPTEFIDITSYGDGIDTMDKAPGKAMTYSDKYALMKAYKISTGEDPDQDASPEPTITKKQSSYLKNILKGHDDIQLKMLQKYGVRNIDELTLLQATNAIKTLTDAQTKARAKKEETRPSEDGTVNETTGEVEEKILPEQIAKINALLSEERRAQMLNAYKRNSVSELTEKEAEKVLEKLKRESK